MFFHPRNGPMTKLSPMLLFAALYLFLALQPSNPGHIQSAPSCVTYSDCLEACINGFCAPKPDFGGNCEGDLDCIGDYLCIQDKCSERNLASQGSKEGLPPSHSHQRVFPKPDLSPPPSPLSGSTSEPTPDSIHHSSCATNGDCLAGATCVDSNCIPSESEVCDDDFDCPDTAKCINDKCTKKDPVSAKDDGLSTIEILGIVAGIITGIMSAGAALWALRRRYA
eukprot:Plantae.Rhodophyta-Hildenbrandia_rubra.ctg14486.p1 GENE.Plantae.Rhodophyta-Hildenbrandia_rubra.ctg14486~~Plantae.Rhodophyta-Hildenbrandia_rubra.ctg14486.p1  ORF type:complete len:224 (-),score=18.78 Plantae.Rhodophyta-Hildenbrandia_rubra.ctg14486:1449-2120(-)